MPASVVADGKEASCRSGSGPPASPGSGGEEFLPTTSASGCCLTTQRTDRRYGAMSFCVITVTARVAARDADASGSNGRFRVITVMTR
jgi:hypothetical protein